MPSFRHDDEGEGYCDECGCDLNPLGWFVMHKPDCSYRAAERRREDDRAMSQYGLTPEEANREVTDAEFEATLRRIRSRLGLPPRRPQFQDLHLDDSYNPRSIHWVSPRERAARAKAWRYDHPYKWSPHGPECAVCGFVHEPNREPEGG